MITCWQYLGESCYSLLLCLAIIVAKQVINPVSLRYDVIVYTYFINLIIQYCV